LPQTLCDSPAHELDYLPLLESRMQAVLVKQCRVTTCKALAQISSSAGHATKYVRVNVRAKTDSIGEGNEPHCIEGGPRPIGVVTAVLQ
jgi:hypothetical protein